MVSVMLTWNLLEACLGCTIGKVDRVEQGYCGRFRLPVCMSFRVTTAKATWYVMCT